MTNDAPPISFTLKYTLFLDVLVVVFSMVQSTLLFLRFLTYKLFIFGIKISSNVPYRNKPYLHIVHDSRLPKMGLPQTRAEKNCLLTYSACFPSDSFQRSNIKLKISPVHKNADISALLYNYLKHRHNNL